MNRVPLVDYLVLEPEPHLVAHECLACEARYFDRRNACASCEADEFRLVDCPTVGEVVSYTIVSFAAPGIRVPFVAAVVDCGGTWVKANLVGVDPSPEHVALGMRVKLTTTSLGLDGDGVEAIGYGFKPLSWEDER